MHTHAIQPNNVGSLLAWESKSNQITVNWAGSTPLPAHYVKNNQGVSTLISSALLFSHLWVKSPHGEVNMYNNGQDGREGAMISVGGSVSAGMRLVLLQPLVLPPCQPRVID